MRVQLTTILLLAAPIGARAEETAAPPAAPVPVVADAPAVPAPIVPPVAIRPDDPVAAPARAPEPVTGGSPPAQPVATSEAPALPPKSAPPVVPSQALVEKVGQADRLFLAGDYRNALFAYQDAVYMQPQYAPARVRLGRAYLALRYPAQALAQAEAALAIDPENADARRLVEEAKTPARPIAPAQPSAVVASASPPAAPAAIPDPPAPAGTRRIYRLTPEPESRSTPPRPRVEAAPHAPSSVPSTAPAVAAAAEPGAGVGAAVLAASPAAAPAPPSGSAAQHYRAALVLLQNREWTRAIAELSTALLADPKLAVAYAARGSAHFGLGKYREAADDYRGALVIDPGMATPVYGLAECYRVLGDGRNAVEMYQRYAQSSAPDVRDDLRAIAAKRAQELR